MKASNNKFLTINHGVVLTPVIEPVIVHLDQFFQAAGLRARVTSGLRDAVSQLNIIKRYLRVRGLDARYPEVMDLLAPDQKIGTQYVWQQAWSHLLNVGVIINPPLAATVLMDYRNPRTGKNMIGQVINQTPHARGICFDIGGAGGADATIADELEVVKRAAGKVPGLVGYLAEHNNNAIHCDCKSIAR